MPRDQLSPSKQILKADTMTHFHESIEHLCCVLIKLESWDVPRWREGSSGEGFAEDFPAL